MFSSGNRRTPRHNLQIASFLSFVAGIVSVVGFFAVSQLTTNVTGHFAFLIDDVFHLNFWKGLVYFLFIFFFLLGSFLSNFIVEMVYKRSAKYVYIIPALIECILLLGLGLFGKYLLKDHPNVIAYLLLFAMGFQNALVTRISDAVVRTTHLTGLFTDLGIELSQLFFYRDKKSKKELHAIIRLRFTIIGCFFVGGIFGGVFYDRIGFYTLLFASLTLLLAIRYESIKMRLNILQGKLTDKNP